MIVHEYSQAVLLHPVEGPLAHVPLPGLQEVPVLEDLHGSLFDEPVANTCVDILGRRFLTAHLAVGSELLEGKPLEAAVVEPLDQGALVVPVLLADLVVLYKGPEATPNKMLFMHFLEEKQATTQTLLVHCSLPEDVVYIEHSIGSQPIPISVCSVDLQVLHEPPLEAGLLQVLVISCSCLLHFIFHLEIAFEGSK